MTYIFPDYVIELVVSKTEETRKFTFNLIEKRLSDKHSMLHSTGVFDKCLIFDAAIIQ